ncbi:MAG: YkgJ family cysteine cluster protein [Huintestinicola sp.]
MLKNILSPEKCAGCRICCIFDSYDIWETPVVSRELRDRILSQRSDIEFISKGDSIDSFLFKVRPYEIDGRGLFSCPALDHSKGCTLGDNKPFDCKIWPYRIMDMNGRRVITIASICPELYARPLKELVDELKNGLADIIFREADKNPDIIKPYEDGYPVLMAEKMHI